MVDDIIIGDVRYMQCHTVFNIMNVIEVAALIWQKRIDNRYLDVGNLEEAVRQITADKSEAARDQHGSSLIFAEAVERH